MATNLLLEGDDLEALLLKAHSEGGPNARIVRADKYRHGGLWGFFARERFEVAVEIPQSALDTAGASFFVPTETRTAGAGPAPTLAAAAAAAATPAMAGPPAAPEPPDPAAWAAEGLLGLADRVSAAERAAARVVRARYAQAADPDLSADPVEPAHVEAELVAAGRTITDSRLSALHTISTPSANGTVTTSMSSSRPGSGDGHEDLTEGAAPQLRPSTSRPEFTALLDTLRDGARPARAGRGGRASASRVESLRTYLDEHRDDGLIGQGPIAPRTLLEESTIGAPPDDAVRGAQNVVEQRPAAPSAVVTPRIPAQAQPVAAESDTRVTADRRTLQELGVPAAWTRELRPGDRFSAVLRMLERMPESDVDPDSPVVAVVGPAETVRLEAYRTALDLATADGPRPVVVLPTAAGPERAAAIATALGGGPVVLAIEADQDRPLLVLDTLAATHAAAVIAVVDATVPMGRTRRWLDALGRVDALVLDGATLVPDPAAVLQVGLPVVRLDGIPVDRITWTALLCAQLVGADRAAGRKD